ncbi:IS110 family transposase [Parasegetibacter sp. NRK P23]|uniref:IS110 family transposase n=1 Tax=Parasegetibacter sp. NRK P23 TaxID=2942999 RepID=UPI002042E65A|nr:IS110 family transposase [Parasegetibacter sp. NRK P23]MCM5530104.1 IS110 family transposase [Parasegetibacter sp. NRK P23]
MQVIKQSVGVDVASKELVVSFSRMYAGGDIEHVSNQSFPNSPKGFEKVVQMAGKLFESGLPVWYLMEATGVYHEGFAYYLEESGCLVSVIMPSKISNYARTLDIKTVTDKTSSQAIARFGLERKLDSWKRPKTVLRSLRQLTRERDQIVVERTLLKNQLHAERSEAFPGEKSIERMISRITLLNKQEAEVKEEIREKLASDAALKQKAALMCTVPGVGTLTAAVVLAETNEFELIRNKRQLVSYAGLDVKEKQSGTSVKGKPRLSKQGNRYLRKALHMPALSALRCDERMKTVFARLVSKHGIKMKAVVAIQRKLLEVLYTLWKKNEKYDEEYFKLGTHTNKIEQSLV